MAELQSFADSGRLLARVSHAYECGERVTFLFGSALTAPGSNPEEKGVPGVTAIIEDVVRSFRGTDEMDSLEEVLNRSDPSARYQEVMQFVIDCRGQNALNDFIKSSVLKARNQPAAMSDDPEVIEMNAGGWYLRPAVEAVGRLCVENPRTFSAPILTSNFDPLLEVSIRRAGGHAAAIFLSADGQFTNVLSPEKKVVHFHGYWRGSDTLHTPGQLTRNRPQLKGCLRTLLRETTLIVVGYGGWSDVFTRTLVDVIGEQMEQLNVLWTFYSDNDEDIANRNQMLLKQFEPLAGQRVIFYKGVDCHVFLPRLREKLLGLRKLSSVVVDIDLGKEAAESPEVAVSESLDHPPMADAWVGRETELRQMLSSWPKVIAITGLGGNGKSTLAAKYLELRQGAEEIAYSCWADCREQGNTLHTKLVGMAERISNGKVKASQLGTLDTESVIETLLGLLGDTKAILVFDNIDQYVDVEECKAVNSMGMLMERALSRNHSAQFIFTARPKLEYSDANFLQLQLGGLSVEETRRLFEVRGVTLDPARASGQMTEVYVLTRGHALALNLIATQVAKKLADLNDLISRLRSGVEAGVEHPIFPEIWASLNPKQQTVLRYLAELVHPEAEQRAASYLGHILNYNQFSKAIKALKTLNLVVVKSPGNDAPDTIELHPLIRDFIRRRFPMSERAECIDSIIQICNRMIGKFRATIFSAPYSVLENWTAKVELCLECARYPEALEALAEVDDSLRRNGYSEELVRLAVEVLSHYKLTNDEKELKWHDGVYDSLVTTLSELGRFDEADSFIGRFEETVKGKTARYVLLCQIRAYSYWLRFKYKEAKDWAQRGVDLKASGDLDTHYDCSHTLALARRDSGEIKPALEYFLEGEKLEAVLDPAEVDQNRGGQFYGNIGRCLHFQKQLDGALTCYKKSARILERTNDSNTLMNIGWAALWIGQVLEAKGNFEMAYVAFRRAASKWKLVSPIRATEAIEGGERVREKLPSRVVVPAGDWECDRAYLDWLRKN